jgi:hypothetical protein
MKRMMFLLSLMVIVLSACGAAPATSTPAPVMTDMPVLPSDTPPAPTAEAPSPKLPAAPFDARTYINHTDGFALDYPAGWSVNEMAIGSRATQVQFLSSPELAEAATLPEGATRLSATIYQWDPKNDLAAYVANRKTAWEASGFTIAEEQQLTLELGLPAVQLTVQTPDAPVVFLFAALGDQYLELSGEGDLELIRVIAGRLRPISP